MKDKKWLKRLTYLMIILLFSVLSMISFLSNRKSHRNASSHCLLMLINQKIPNPNRKLTKWKCKTDMYIKKWMKILTYLMNKYVFSVPPTVNYQSSKYRHLNARSHQFLKIKGLNWPQLNTRPTKRKAIPFIHNSKFPPPLLRRFTSMACRTQQSVRLLLNKHKPYPQR